MVLHRTSTNGSQPTAVRRTVMDNTPLPAALAPAASRVKYFVILWLVKAVVSCYLAITFWFRPSPNSNPTFVKYYACRPSLQVRIFIPKQVYVRESPAPLYIDIHGGGFAVGDASIDDIFCTNWAARTGMITVSLNYSKTPLHPFPSAVHDIAQLARAVIDDVSLPIDKSRVVMGGFSAGGNLNLTASLLPALRGKIKATVSYYPIVDWSSPPHVKFAQRLFTDRPGDSIAMAGDFLDWGYVRAGQNRKEKLLSPCYAKPDELPESVCIIAAQHDMLCREARDMMYALSGVDIPEKGWDDGFEVGGYKWVLVRGVKHGFTDEIRRGNSPREDKRRRICDELYTDVARWLEKKVWN